MWHSGKKQYSWRSVQMAKNMRKRKEKKQPDILLSEGIMLAGGFHEQREGRWADLFARAIFLFAMVTGSLGGMLSAFDVSYAKWAFFLSAFLASLYCASLYSSALWENTGYILIFIFIVYVGFGLRTYISSGFYGILNDITVAASTFFESDAQISYAEQVENHALAISIAMCYFAIIGCIITNVLISRKTKYLAASALAVAFLLVPIYLEHEPSGGYIILIAAGIITVYVFRQNQYLCQRPKPRTLQKAARNHLFTGNFSGQAAIGTLLLIALICSIVVGFMELLLPKDSYLASTKRSSLKLQTMDTMENLYLLGVMGLINFYPNTGGLVNGRLGGVGSVRLDYETDLTLEFVPYTYDRIYLRTFVGAEYVPYENHWNIQDQTAYAERWSLDTADRLENAFLSGMDNYARGIMKIKNVAAMTGVYLPYYSKDTDKVIRPGMTQEYTFFPLLTNHPDGSHEPPVSRLWLSVPEENQQAIADFCTEAGLSGSTQDIIVKLRDYFQEEFPYTLSPGITPRRKDFVNYFLTEKRKGYCAHYASCAVLILRYMGIPARYVEGYAVDAIEIVEDAKLTDDDASDYYEGNSLLSEGSVVSYDASDGNAHAWVEIYDEELGWYPIELTPYRTDTENDRGSIWDMFTRLFRSEQAAELGNANLQDQIAGAAITGAIRTSAYKLALCLILLLLVIPVRHLVKKVIRLYRYQHSDRNGKLLMIYHNLIRKICVKNRRNKQLDTLINFEEQVAWLAENEILTADTPSLERLIRTLNDAAFSPREISGEAFAAACKVLSDFSNR